MTRTKHGMYKSATFKTWQYMHDRCRRDERYIKNGITVCDRWKDFANFYADMGERPEKLTLDRIDGSKGYSPDNCRWATYKEQNRNLSSNVRYGSELLVEIAERTGLSRTTIKYRVENNQPVDAPLIHERTHCKAGHEWNEKNTYITQVKRKQGGYRYQRYCRVCRALAQAALRERRKINIKEV